MSRQQENDQALSPTRARMPSTSAHRLAGDPVGRAGPQLDRPAGRRAQTHADPRSLASPRMADWTPVCHSPGVLPLQGGFVVPLTFSDASRSYRNIRAAGSCVITWRGVDHAVVEPVIVDGAAARPAYPRYERIALRLLGIDEFVWLREAH